MRIKECLNGEWDFHPIYNEYEPADSIDSQSFEDKILVPSSWRCLLADNTNNSPDYRPYDMFGYPDIWNTANQGIIAKTINIKKIENYNVWLVFNGILQRSKIYINNKLIEESQEAFLPIKIDITQYIKSNENEIDIMVWCGSFKNIDTQNGARHLAPDGSWFAKMARGIWQDVFIEYVPEVHIYDYQIITSVRNKSIEIKSEIFHANEQEDSMELKASIFNGEILVKRIHSQNTETWDGGCRIDLFSAWEEPICWSPENPHLYSLTLELLSNGETVDRVTTRFGFREVWTEKHKFYINGVRINLRGDSWHYQGYIQQTHEYALNWYKICRQTGINYVRPHAMPYPEFYLDAADEAGMLIIDESAIYGSSKSILSDHREYLENCSKHLKKLIRRDRNHPSVIVWSMQNEMRWVDGRDIYQKHMKELMDNMKELDGTRLISCDGDNRMLDNDTMQVVTMHYNIDGTVDSWDKCVPLFFGEHGKWHFISPQVCTEFAGQDAYTNFEEALRSLGKEERLFLEYARKEEVTGIAPFNMCNYMMYTMPDEDIRLHWKESNSFGAKPAVIVNNSMTINNGLVESAEICRFNESYEEVREGYLNVCIVADEYNVSFFDSIDVVRNFSIYNDTLTCKLSKLEYEIISSNGRVISSGEETYNHKPGEIFPFSLKFSPGKIREKTKVFLRMKLLQEGIEKYNLIKEYFIYPSSLKKEHVDCKGFTIAYAGGLECLDTISAFNENIILIKDLTELESRNVDILILGKNYEPYMQVQNILDSFTKAGGVLLVLEQDDFCLGDVTLSGKKFFKVYKNVQEHRIFRGIEDNELEFWGEKNIFHPECSTIVSNSFKKPVAGDFKILLECGGGNFGLGGLEWTPMLEYVNGAGKVILNQLELIEFFDSVPQACVILRNLINYTADCREEFRPSCNGKNTLMISEKQSGFQKFFDNIDLHYSLSYNDNHLLEQFKTIIIDPDIIGSLETDKIRRYVKDGGTVFLPAFQPVHLKKVQMLSDQVLDLELNEVYQLKTADHPFMEGISDFDLYCMEKVTYAPETCKNMVVSDYSITFKSGEALLENVRTPWKQFFVDGLDAEAIKMSIASLTVKNEFSKKYYGTVIQYGKGKFVFSQVKLLDNDKIKRYYTRLMCNMGAEVRKCFLEYVKEPDEYSIPSFMSLKYDGKSDINEEERYFSNSNYKLNNLGEGPYGWMVRRDAEDGFITIPQSSGNTYFMTVYINSDINRNPFKRKEGQLPDSSIVPDLIICTNHSFRVWINGICYKDFKKECSEMVTVKIDDILLEEGLNTLLLVCFGSDEDIKVNTYFQDKCGEHVKGLKYTLTLD